MNRSLVAMAGALLSLGMGCAKTETASQLGCQPADFDLSACDVPAVSAVKAEGVWQANVDLGGLDTPGALRLLSDNPLLFDTPLVQRPGSGEPFFLASEFPSSTGTSRLVLSACQAPDATRVTGQFRRCTPGGTTLGGTFEAVRTQRAAGEAEASGVTLVGEAALPRGSAEDVFVSEGYAYVTAGADGLFIFDVHDPKSPVKVAEVQPTQESWHRAWVRSKTLYLSSSTQGLVAYDVSDPKLPKRITLSAPVPVEAWGLVAAQDKLYVISPSPNAEVLIYSIAQPEKPLLMKRYFVPDSLPANGEIPVEGVVAGNRLFLGHWRFGLAVVDVTDPNAPTYLGHFPYEGATSRPVAVGQSGDQTLVFEASEGWDSRVRVLNATDAGHITQIGQFQSRPQSTVSAMTLMGNKLYVAYAQEGLRILNISTPGTPILQAYYNTWRESDPGRGRAFLDGLSAVKVEADGYLYAAETSRGLLVLREQ